MEMPYKDRRKRRQYMRDYMRVYYKRQKEQLEKLKAMFPDAYEVVFGKRRRRKKK